MSSDESPAADAPTERLAGGIRFEVSYPARPSAVFGVLTDVAFFEECATAMGALDHETQVRRADGLCSTRTRLVVSTSGIPVVFEPLVGPEVTLRLSRSWHRDGHGYQATWRVATQVRGRQARVEGRAALARSDDGAAYLAEAEVHEVDVPTLLRPLAVSLVETLCRGALENESGVALDWLSRSRRRSRASRA
jgi:hypothetical protein